VVVTPCPAPGQLGGIPLVLPLTRRHLHVYTHFGNPSAERLIRPHLTPKFISVTASHESSRGACDTNVPFSHGR
jgi:hypothetical protein